MSSVSKRIAFLIVGFAALLLLSERSALSQIPQPNAPAGTTKSSADPLGRETPYGTVFGFLEAAQSGNYSIAAEYLQMSPARRQAQGDALAMRLNVAMNRAFRGSLRPSRQPEGTPQEDVAPDRQKLGTMSSGDVEADLDLVRVSDPSAGKIWLFSSETLGKIPELYDQIQARRVETRLPAWMVRHELAGMPLWQWLALLLLIPVAAAVGWVALVLIEIPLLWRIQKQVQPGHWRWLVV